MPPAAAAAAAVISRSPLHVHPISPDDDARRRRCPMKHAETSRGLRSATHRREINP